MTLQNALNSSAGVALGFGLSRLPTHLGYRFADWLSARVAARKNSDPVRAVRANQWVVQNGQVDAPTLDRLVQATFRSTGRSLYEFWHYFRNPQAILRMVEFDDSFIARFREAREAQRGMIIVVPHMSNFDLIGRAAALRGYPLHILSYPHPPGSYKLQNSIREAQGLRITPLSMESLRQASETLRNCGTVATGIDRPLPGDEQKYRALFFGRKAAVPVFHIRLAIKHRLPIVVVAGRRTREGRYHVWASDPIPMRTANDLVEETVQNAEAVLQVLADFIRTAPEQWAMFYPVWPEALNAMPA